MSELKGKGDDQSIHQKDGLINKENQEVVTMDWSVGMKSERERGIGG